jgi:hypothetical protein
VVGQVDRHHVVARLRERARAHLMKAYPEMLLVDADAQVAVIVSLYFSSSSCFALIAAFFDSR